jgi:hypothetical protein
VALGELLRRPHLIDVLDVGREGAEGGVPRARQRLIEEVDLAAAKIEPDVAQEPVEAVALRDIALQINFTSEGQ